MVLRDQRRIRCSSWNALMISYLDSFWILG